MSEGAFGSTLIATLPDGPRISLTIDDEGSIAGASNFDGVAWDEGSFQVDVPARTMTGTATSGSHTVQIEMHC